MVIMDFKKEFRSDLSLSILWITGLIILHRSGSIYCKSIGYLGFCHCFNIAFLKLPLQFYFFTYLDNSVYISFCLTLVDSRVYKLIYFLIFRFANVLECMFSNHTIGVLSLSLASVNYLLILIFIYLFRNCLLGLGNTDTAQQTSLVFTAHGSHFLSNVCT